MSVAAQKVPTKGGGTAAPARWRPTLVKFQPILIKSCGLLTLVILWWIGSLVLPPTILPGPGRVVTELIANYQEGVLLSNFFSTMTRIVLGFVFAMGAGIAFGTVMGLSRVAEEFFDLWIMVGITIPSLAILLILYILFGLNEFATILAIGLSAFPAIAINVWQGVKSVDNKLLAMGRVYGVNRSRRFTQIVFPQIAPYLVASSRFGLGIIWKITVVAELIGRDSGIGFQLHYWFQLFNMPQVFAWTLFFTLIMLVIELGIFKPVERRLFRWRPATKF
ncbi:MAG: NitT/TauT family transport system permease protein [Alphaproteobacteria bacterium]|jgi:NitT/TauT family transport system permease protein|nr:NitT/TauT family transport system permease protein [Alphaproteobacteria bacterium]